MNDFIEGQNLILRPITDTDTDTDNILKWRNSNDVRNNFTACVYKVPSFNQF